MTNSRKMFTTEHLQIQDDYTYIINIPSKINSNPRYKFFRQNHFTAGDEDQFLEYWDRYCDEIIYKKPKNLSNWIIHPNIYYNKYKDLNVEDILNTYRYISDKFKKGIFLKIGNQNENKGNVFLPFSKVDYQNEWSEKIKINSKRFKDIIEMMRYTSEKENREFIESRVHKNIKAWYGNNGLVRLEFPTSEGDSGVNILKDMFKTLIKERILPCFECFINKRDFPLLRNDETESYEAFFGERTRLLSHLYRKYAPIFSMTTSINHADIPIPTWEDWSRVSYWYDKRLFGKEYRTFSTPEEFDKITWEMKKPIAIFRGASTGQGTLLTNNIRLLLSAESKRMKLEGIEYLDAGITKWNLRPRKHPNHPYLETIHLEEMPFDLVEPKSPLEQCEYKYIIHLPGHSAAYRLSLELYMGSVILYYPCLYHIWYFPLLRPWIHYVPLTGTIEDIKDKIKWCMENDEECKKIANNAKIFAKKMLSRESILDYLQKMIWETYEMTGKIIHLPKNIMDRNKDLYLYNRKIWKKRLEEMENISENHILYEQLKIYRERHIWNYNEIIKDGKNTKIYKLESHDKLVIKKTKKNWKYDELFHSLCGYLFINTLSLKYPHYIYTYWDQPSNNEEDIHYIITDYIQGDTLENSISKWNFTTLISFYMYISLILQIGQNYCGFIHMDLYPWNIILKNNNNRYKSHFSINNKTIEIESEYIPVIIDYGKSHFIYKGKSYYNSCPFNFSQIQDIISIVFSTLYIYIDKSNNKISQQEIQMILKLMEFFSSEYTNNIKLNTIYQVKTFLKRKKKYSRMLGEEKIGLENKIPFNLFEFIIKNKFPYNFKSFNIYNKINIYYPLIIDFFIKEDEFFKLWNIYYNESLKNIDRYSIIELRQEWIKYEQLIKIYEKNKSIYSYKAIQWLKNNIKNKIKLYEKKKNEKVWDNIVIENIEKDIIYSENKIEYKNIEKQNVKLPVLSSHLSKLNIEKKLDLKNCEIIKRMNENNGINSLSNNYNIENFFSNDNHILMTIEDIKDINK